MKIKINPVIIIFTVYLCLGLYLVFAYFSLHSMLAAISTVNLQPFAYVVLTLGVTLSVLSLFSLLRIPFFHYLFKLFHLWILIIIGIVLWVYYEYGYLLSEMFSVDTQQSIVKTFPVTNPDMFQPLIKLFQSVLTHFKQHDIYYLLFAALLMAIVQVILYLPSSLRFVYHSHISPIKYTIKHLLVSVVLFLPLFYIATYYPRLDTRLNPQLEALLAKQPAEIAVDKNAFYPLLSVWLTESQAPVAAGQMWLAEYQKMLAYFRNIQKPLNRDLYPQYRALKLYGMDRQDQERINQLYVHLLNDPDTQDRNELHDYVQRYTGPLQTMAMSRHYKAYANPLNYVDDSVAAYFQQYAQSFLSLHRLFLAQSLLNHTDDQAALLRDINVDYNFNLMVIRSSSDPQVKLMHINKQVITIEFLNTLLQRPAYQNSGMYQQITRLPNLAKLVIDHGNVARHKILLLRQQLDLGQAAAKNMQGASAFIIHYAFKYNQTLNCIYRDAVRKYNLNVMDPASHIRAQEKARPKPGLDNVIGNVICNASLPQGDSAYYTQAVEANGRMMILKARSRILEEGISDVNINAFLTNNAARFFNPFSAAALKWDREAHRIFFEYNNGQEPVRVVM